MYSSTGAMVGQDVIVKGVVEMRFCVCPVVRGVAELKRGARALAFYVIMLVIIVSSRHVSNTDAFSVKYEILELGGEPVKKVGEHLACCVFELRFDCDVAGPHYQRPPHSASEADFDRRTRTQTSFIRSFSVNFVPTNIQTKAEEVREQAAGCAWGC